MSRSNEFDSSSISVFAGNANPSLAQEITRHLHVPLGRAHVGRFSDGEVNAELMENVRGRDVFIGRARRALPSPLSWWPT